MLLSENETLRATSDRKILYPIGDRPTKDELDALGFEGNRLHILQPDQISDPEEIRYKIMAVKSQIFREPRKNEWYLSGAVPQAWKAPNDLGPTQKFWICQLVLVSVKIRPLITVEKYGAEPSNS